MAIKELPFGWTYQNRVFCEKIQNETNFFRDKWIASFKKGNAEKYAALKSFVLYLEDALRLCRAKGELFALWFDQIVADEAYLKKRKNELLELEKELNKNGKN